MTKFSNMQRKLQTFIGYNLIILLRTIPDKKSYEIETCIHKETQK